jgi:hypothetical protein
MPTPSAAVVKEADSCFYFLSKQQAQPATTTATNDNKITKYQRHSSCLGFIAQRSAAEVGHASPN